MMLIFPGLELGWVKPRACVRDAWLFYRWDVRHHCEGPHVMVRERGYRVLGLELSYRYRAT